MDYMQEWANDCEIKPQRFGMRSDNESATKWAVFDRKEVEEAFDLDSDLATNLTGWYRFYRGPGQSFGDDPWVQIGRTRIVVRHFTGLDI